VKVCENALVLQHWNSLRFWFSCQLLQKLCRIDTNITDNRQLKWFPN